jgi:two-component system, chemotaxis family, chemotaxis protein CheY
MKTMFLVNDSATILLSISNSLAKAGYVTEIAGSGEEDLINTIKPVVR